MLFFSQVFSLRNIQLLQKKMLWLNGLQILPTLLGWKVRDMNAHLKTRSAFRVPLLSFRFLFDTTVFFDFLPFLF